MQINQMRFAGLASGLDTETIIQELMNAERHPLNKLFQKKQTLEWQRDSYREVNTLLKGFDTSIFDGVYRRATFNQKIVTSSNESAVSARAVSANANTSSQIHVQQLATSEVWVADGHDFTQGARTLEFAVVQPGQSEATNVTIEIGENDTLEDVLRKFNNSNLGVTLFEDEYMSGGETHKNLVMTMNQTGEGASIVVEDGADFMASLGFAVDSDGVLTSSIQGQNAKFQINGYETERSSNVFTINGMEYTLKNTTDTAVTLSSATDVDSIFDTVVKFVDDYNTMLAELNGKITEPRYRDFPPLTDEQKEEMTDKQIEMWEDKARSGLLRNDTILSGGLNQMRMDLYSGVKLEDGTTVFLSDFGISPVNDYRARGRLEINADKLREAISEDPNRLYELFNGSSRPDASSEHAEIGIADRLRQSMKQVTERIEERAGNSMRTNHQFSLGRNIIDVDSQIERMQDRLQRIEQRYWNQFTAMERVIQQANQQSVFLFEQFGGF